MPSGPFPNQVFSPGYIMPHFPLPGYPIMSPQNFTTPNFTNKIVETNARDPSSSPIGDHALTSEENLHKFIDWTKDYFNVRDDELDLAFHILKDHKMGVEILGSVNIETLEKIGLALGTAIKITRGFRKWKKHNKKR